LNRFQRLITNILGIDSKPLSVIPRRKEIVAKGDLRSRGVYFPKQPRLLDKLFISYLSADGELVIDFIPVRSVARQLSKQNDLARRYLDLVSNNVMGANGIILQPDLGKDDINKLVLDLWNKWGECVTADGRMSWLDAQDYVARTVARDGEVFAHFITGKDAGNQFGFAIEFIESEYLNHFDNEVLANGNQIKMGVEVNGFNRPINYHFFDYTKVNANSPAIGQGRIILPAEDVIHLYRHDISAFQSRGISWLHPILMSLYSYMNYMDAEQEALALIANSVIFFESDDALGAFANNDTGINPGNQTNNGFTGPITGPANPPQTELTIAPGSPVILPPGLKAHQLNTNHPGTSFKDWVNKRLQGIASGLNVSYASLTGDLSQANNASQREGTRNERDYWQKIQSWYIDKLHCHIYREFIKNCVLNGVLKGLPSDFYKVNWQPRGYAGYDAYKDAKSYADLINTGIKSRTQIITELGGDPKKVFDELAFENAYAKELGIDINGQQINAYEVKAGAENQPNEDELNDNGDVADETENTNETD